MTDLEVGDKVYLATIHADNDGTYYPIVREYEVTRVGKTFSLDRNPIGLRTTRTYTRLSPEDLNHFAPSADIALESLTIQKYRERKAAQDLVDDLGDQLASIDIDGYILLTASEAKVNREKAKKRMEEVTKQPSSEWL